MCHGAGLGLRAQQPRPSRPVDDGGARVSSPRRSADRLRSRGAEGRGLGWNWGRIVEELSFDRPGLFAFAGVGAVLLLARLRQGALPLVSWLPASLLLLLVHTPLHGKHIVTLIPPAALLASPRSRLNMPAISRASSRCCFWSSPTGTWVAL